LEQYDPIGEEANATGRDLTGRIPTSLTGAPAGLSFKAMIASHPAHYFRFDFAFGFRRRAG
jgi:hypothetical protein